LDHVAIDASIQRLINDSIDRQIANHHSSMPSMPSSSESMIEPSLM
jgi:hypothetical protein